MNKTAARAPAARRIGPYQIERRLASGGMAELYVAKRPMGPSSFKRAVIKLMLPELVEDPRFVDMFLREAGILAQLNHANVIQIFDLGATPEGSPYIAMEYLEGISAEGLAHRAWRHGRPLPLEMVLRIITDAARGLDYVHSQCDDDGHALNLVHRDVSPDNLFFRRDGTVKLLDFGIARGAATKVLTSAGELKGKLPFLSPEQLDDKPVDGRTDLYALGVSAYWLLTGKRPFEGRHEVELMNKILMTTPAPPSALCADVPRWLDDVIMRFLEKDRTMRFQTGAEVEQLIVHRAGTRLDRVADVMFLEEVLALEAPAPGERVLPVAAARRPDLDVFARVPTKEIVVTAPGVPRPISLDTPGVRVPAALDPWIGISLPMASDARTTVDLAAPLAVAAAVAERPASVRSAMRPAARIAAAPDDGDKRDTAELTEADIQQLLLSDDD